MRKVFLVFFLFLLASAVEAKTLIAYYSFTGNCKSIVKELQSQIKADAIEIEPLEKGLDYAANNYKLGDALIAAIKKNPKAESSYPSIKEIKTDLSQYSTIIVVAPIWWDQMAAPMQTFLFKNGKTLAGKNIGLIISSYSSGISGAENDAKRLIPEGKFLKKSLWFTNSDLPKRKSMISEWLKTVSVK